MAIWHKRAVCSNHQCFKNDIIKLSLMVSN